MYYVTSNGDEPFRIFFNEKDATNERDQYIDVFDEEGFPVKTLHLREDDTYEEWNRK